MCWKNTQKNATEFFEPDIPSSITVSIGATKLSSINSFEEGFLMADQALYKAKSAGRNKVVQIQISLKKRPH